MCLLDNIYTYNNIHVCVYIFILYLIFLSAFLKKHKYFYLKRNFYCLLFKSFLFLCIIIYLFLCYAKSVNVIDVYYIILECVVCVCVCVCVELSYVSPVIMAKKSSRLTVKIMK